MTCNANGFLVCIITRLLDEPVVYYVAVGVVSRISGSVALFVRALTQSRLRSSIIHGEADNIFTDYDLNFFVCTGQGRVGADFFGCRAN